MSETPQSTGTVPEKAAASRGRKRKLVGTVVSAKMQKTIVVQVSRRVLDPVFKKFVRHRKHYKVHDESGCKPGDEVEISEHRPISRDKHWIVTRVIARHEEA